MRKRKFSKKVIAVLTSLMIILMFGGQALVAVADNSGALWTTDSEGNVNVNIYDSKEDVYLNGGPKGGMSGLEDGEYYVQITTPDGTVLGSSSPGTITVAGGIFEHVNLWNILTKASNNSKGYDTTTNTGGEYKVWISKNSAFKDSESKTDNFKARIHPRIEVVKTASPTSARQGDSITYNYTITNTGDMPLTDVTLEDNKLGAITLTGTTLDVSGSVTGTANHTVLKEDFPGPIVNTATATGQYGDNEKDLVTAIASASVNLTKSLDPIPGIHVDKTANPATARLGDTVTYSYKITNTGDIDFTTVSLVDDKLGTIDLNTASEANTIPLIAGNSVTVTKAHTLVAGDFPEGSQTLTNTATATGNYGGNETISAMDSANVTLLASPPELEPGISLDKTVDKTTAQIGDTVTYTYVVRNIGQLDLFDVSLQDDKLGSIDLNVDNHESEVIVLEKGKAITVSKAYTVQSGDLPLTNLAIVKGYYGETEGDFVTAQDSVTIEQRTTPPEPPILPEEKPGMIEVTKTIEGGEPQAGITFKLYKGEVLLKTGVTNAQGILLFNGLGPAKDYSLEEIVPQGFKTNLNKETLVTVTSETTTKIAVVNTPTVPPAMEEGNPQPVPLTEDNKPASTPNTKELPITGGYPLAYLISGLIAAGLGLSVRKRK